MASRRYDEQELDLWARETGQPLRQPGEEMRRYRIRVARHMILQGRAPELAVQMYVGKDAHEAPTTLAHAHAARRAFRAGVSAVLPTFHSQGPFRLLRQRLVHFGFESVLRERFRAPHVFIDRPSAEPTFEIWHLAESSILLVATSYIRYGTGEEWTNEVHAYAQVDGWDPSAPGAVAPDFVRHLRGDGDRPGSEHAFGNWDIEGRLPRVHRVGLDSLIEFVGDVRGEPALAFAPRWSAEGRIRLHGALSDYSLPSPCERTSRESDEWEDVAEHLEPWQTALRADAKALGVDLQGFQAGRRLSLLPKAVFRLVSARPEAYACLAHYHKGFAGGLRLSGLEHPYPNLHLVQPDFR